MSYDVLVIGGGVAGLSAAVEIADRGGKVLVLEQRPHPGGRTYSYRDRVTHDVVDNGQHLLMGCYHETRRYLDLIGSSHLATLQHNLRIDFLHPRNGKSTLLCPSLPAPLHILAGLLRLKTVPLAQRLNLLRVGVPLILGANEQELARLTVDQWLERLKQTAANRKYLWDVIAIGSLNDDPGTVSALLFYRILKAAFLGARENSSLLIPRVGLSQLLVEPAVEFIRKRGGDVQASSHVDRLEIARGRVIGLWSGKRKFSAQAYISAVPWYACHALLQHSGTPFDIPRFDPSPILTINLWLDREVMEEQFAAVLDCNVQWVFNKTRIFGLLDEREEDSRTARVRRTTARQYLSCVISGAKEYLTWSKERIVQMALQELRLLFPVARSARVVHSLVIREKRATFSPQPSVEPLRPAARTDLDNLFLAGDWTDTGYPATIEGAVLSGRRATEMVLSRP